MRILARLSVLLFSLLLFSSGCAHQAPAQEANGNKAPWSVSSDHSTTVVSIGTKGTYRISNDGDGSVEVMIDGNQWTVVSPGNSTDVKVEGGRIELKRMLDKDASGSFEKLSASIESPAPSQSSPPEKQ